MIGTVAEIAQRIGGAVVGDGSVAVERIAAIEDVGANTLTFATDERYLRAALGSRAVAVLADAALVAAGERYPKPLVVVDSARVALAALLTALEPPRPRGPFVHPTAVIDPAATVGAEVYVGPHVTIGPESTIGDRCVLAAGVVIGAGVRIGPDALLHPRAYVADRCVLGARVVLQAGAIVGSDGFGFAFVDRAFRKIPQIGIVELGDDVEIGANACIDRAQTGVTSIGDGTKIDNLVQVAHNCRIGKHVGIAAQAGIAGSATLGDYVQIAGQVGSVGHLTIGTGAKVLAASKVWSDVPDGAMVIGNPAQEHRAELRAQAYVRRLPKLFDRVKALERLRVGDEPSEHES